MEIPVAWMFVQLLLGVALAVVAPGMLHLPTRHRIGGGLCDCGECVATRRWTLAAVILVELVAVGACVVAVTMLVRVVNDRVIG